MFLGPVLRIICSGVVEFLKPVTIQLPFHVRGEPKGVPDPSSCRVRVLFLKSDGKHKEWIDITRDLEHPASFDGTFVWFQVKRFSGYGIKLVMYEVDMTSDHLKIKRDENMRPCGMWLN